jgi:hypothetical protein
MHVLAWTIAQAVACLASSGSRCTSRRLVLGLTDPVAADAFVKHMHLAEACYSETMIRPASLVQQDDWHGTSESQMSASNHPLQCLRNVWSLSAAHDVSMQAC